VSAAERWRGRHLSIVETGGWEHVHRVRGTGVVGIVALTDDRIVLVEQHRPPVGARVLELPAGLVGDDDADEPTAVAAARELLEETGFASDRWQRLAELTSSAGLTDERVELWIARGAHRVAPGGGAHDEDVQVHVVPLPELQRFVRARLAAGVLLDPKVLVAVLVAGEAWDGGTFP
jgi:ADP-ribose pyrophosphatase